jgi:hypothetical protein
VGTGTKVDMGDQIPVDINPQIGYWRIGRWFGMWIPILVELGVPRSIMK